METNEAIKTLKDHKICVEHDFGWNKQVLDALDAAIEALAADVVPVVRCGECRVWDKHWMIHYSRDYEHFCPVLDRVTNADWFCANGERMEGDGDV